MTLHDARPVHFTHRPVLVRFVSAGLSATVESFVCGGLPLTRLARELRARTDTLAELGPPARTLTRLRWLHREVSRLDSALRAAGRIELDRAERAHLAATLATVRDTLATLLAPDPANPAPAAAALGPAPAPATLAVTGTGTARGACR